MKSFDFQSIFAGDKVSIDDIDGMIVFSSISDSYAEDFPKSEWPQTDYNGIMMRMTNGGLMFHDNDVLAHSNCQIKRL
ncbi:MAG: hypothetical protein MUR46_14415 [Loktanella sp.]|jgi:hypothetical protein|nr:hypothetical protein [Loktanella sp.]MDO7607817.1 hypothetical protein [Loktanella sp.]MDO7623010.1 hypothetical protein [Loktanella sp.]MDO7625394.1 hypothetical protein [Loktanella sp.]MDO7631889.1 hypothetical protein [Loktanella sp.]